MASHKLSPASAKRWEVKKQWYQEIKAIVFDLEANPAQAVLNADEQKRLGIQLSDFSGEPEHEEDLVDEPVYFTPVLREHLPVSPCSPSLYIPEEGDEHVSLWRPTKVDVEPEFEPMYPSMDYDYYEGRALADNINCHLKKVNEQSPSMWKHSGPNIPYHRPARYSEYTMNREHNFFVTHVYELPSRRRSHMILLMVSDHSAQEDSLLRSEVLAMTSFMRWKLKKLSRESSLLFPVMVISIANYFKLRILQGYFDGSLHIRRSKLYDFAVEDHEEVMKLAMCWLRSTPHGDTTMSAEMPYFKHQIREESDEEGAEGEEKKVGQGTTEV